MKNFKDKVVYQIWPRSFKDSNGDGIGDIPGILSKLPYLKELGVDMVWLSPIYATGNVDYGYDVDDYCAINPEYGTMADFDDLVLEAKSMGIGIIMDLVLNHTSDRHAWFRQAVSDIDSPYRDYYFFRDGTRDSAGRLAPPNNWLSAFANSAWQYEEKSGQYYLAMFTPHQCDLNWENPDVRREFHQIMTFWMDRGIAGFRFDVINAISKAKDLPAAREGRKPFFPFEHIVSLPRTHEYIQEMHEEVLGRYDCFTVGEGMLTSIEDLALYTAPSRNELDMMFHFDMHLIGCGSLGKYDFRKLYYWRVADMKNIIDIWQTKVQEKGGWLGNYISNHDQPRAVSRFGDDKTFRMESAKALGLLNFTLRGTPFIYQGEEIGMTNSTFLESEWKDYEATNSLRVLQKVLHLPKSFALRVISKMARDHARTPMHWDATDYAGFSSVTPWIKLNPNYTDINVEKDRLEEGSIFQFYQKLVALRKENEVLTHGLYVKVRARNPQTILFLRELGKEKLLVIISLSRKIQRADISNLKYISGTQVLGTHGPSDYSKVLQLKPYEGRIYRLE